MENLMTTRTCAYCGNPFQPRPQVPKQTYCPSPECQRARKLRWQQDKIRTDPDYRDNQRDAQRAWFDRHPGYWPAYRASGSVSLDRSGHRETDGPGKGLAKMDVSTLPSGLYQLQQVTASSAVQNGGWLVEITPICLDCPCKKDACKEMT